MEGDGAVVGRVRKPRFTCACGCGYAAKAEGRYTAGHSPNSTKPARRCACGCGMPTQHPLSPYYRDHRPPAEPRPPAPRRPRKPAPVVHAPDLGQMRGPNPNGTWTSWCVCGQGWRRLTRADALGDLNVHLEEKGGVAPRSGMVEQMRSHASLKRRAA